MPTLPPIEVPCPLCGNPIPVRVGLAAERHNEGDRVMISEYVTISPARLDEAWDAHVDAYHHVDGP